MDKYLLAFGCNQNKLKWIPFVVDNFIKPQMIDNRKKKFIVTCTARFGPASNLIEILKSAKIICNLNKRNIEFIIAGGKPGSNTSFYGNLNGIGPEINTAAPVRRPTKGEGSSPPHHKVLYCIATKSQVPDR